MITYANCNVRFMPRLFCHMYFNTLILRKTTSSVTKDSCHLDRNFTAVRGNGVPGGSRAQKGIYGS